MVSFCCCGVGYLTITEWPFTHNPRLAPAVSFPCLMVTKQQKSLEELRAELNLPEETQCDVVQGYNDYVHRQVVDNAFRVRQRSISHTLFLLRDAIQIELSQSQQHVYEHVLYRPLRLRIRLVAFHQTSLESAVEILGSGHMRPGLRGRAGAGIYFAFSPDVTNYKALSRGVILEVLVAIGKCMDCGHTVPSPAEAAFLLCQAGYDSITYTTPSGPELVVYASDQCTPLRAL